MENFDFGGFGVISINPENENLLDKKFMSIRHDKKTGEIQRYDLPHNINTLIQEGVLAFYFSDSKYIVNIISINILDKILTYERWPYSLKKYQKNLSYPDKLKVFNHILCGLSHLQSRGVIHADIKNTNILYDNNENESCICDLGLSNITKYAKTERCPKLFKPNVALKNLKIIGRDMFSLCITMCNLFFGLELYDEIRFTPAMLRDKINRSDSSPKVKKALKMMVPDDLEKAASASEVLLFLFNKIEDFPLPTLNKYPNIRILPEDLEFIKSKIVFLSQKFSIKRHKRCFNSLVSFINNPEFETIDPRFYDRYIASALLIYSSLFDDPKLYFDTAIKLCSSKPTREIFGFIVVSMMTDPEFVNMTLYPYEK